MSERELRVKIHVAYFYFLNECLKRDPRTGLYVCPSRLALLVMMPMVERVFDFDLKGVPGFYYDPYRDAARELARMCGIDDYPASPYGGGWMVNLPKDGFIKAVMDDRGRITALHILNSPTDPRPRVLTSKGLPLGA